MPMSQTSQVGIGDMPPSLLVKESGIKKDEPHMNALTIDFLDADRIRQTWGCCDGGDKFRNMSVEFKRKK